MEKKEGGKFSTGIESSRTIAEVAQSEIAGTGSRIGSSAKTRETQDRRAATASYLNRLQQHRTEVANHMGVIGTIVCRQTTADGSNEGVTTMQPQQGGIKWQ